MDAEVRVGELLKPVKSEQGKRSDIELVHSDAPKLMTPKQQARESVGITRQHANPRA